MPNGKLPATGRGFAGTQWRAGCEQRKSYSDDAPSGLSAGTPPTKRGSRALAGQTLKIHSELVTVMNVIPRIKYWVKPGITG